MNKKQKVKHEILCLLSLHSKTIKNWLKNYKGAFSAEDEYFDYTEWHAAVSGAAPTALAFLLHPGFLLLPLWITKRLLEDSVKNGDQKLPGFIKEVKQEFPYFAGAVAATTVLMLGLGYRIDVSNPVFVQLVTGLIGA